MGMEGHHRKWWQVPVGKSTVAVINDRVLNLILTLFLLVVIELHRADINLIVIPNLQKAAVQHLLGKMVELRLESELLGIDRAVSCPTEGIQALFEPVAGYVLFVDHIVVFMLLL